MIYLWKNKPTIPDNERAIIMVVIRQAKIEEYDSIYEFVKEAFSTADVSDGTEQDFVLELRVGASFIPELEFVAVEGEELVGHIMFTKQEVVREDSVYMGLLVAPLSVKLSHRSKGVGAALMFHGFGEAEKLGYEAAFLAGNPEYYSRFGYQQTKAFGIKNATEIPDQYVLGCEIRKGALAEVEGTIHLV